MNYLIFCVALVLNIISFQPDNSIYNNIEETCVSVDDVVDTIIMEDDIMLVSTSKSNGNITEIQVFDSNGILVFQNFGCHDSRCSTDVSSLTLGRYTVDVDTSTGYTFTGTIELI